MRARDFLGVIAPWIVLPAAGMVLTAALMGETRSETVQAPYIDLSQYEGFTVRDSTVLCRPNGCADVPEGSIILIPLPRQFPATQPD